MDKKTAEFLAEEKRKRTMNLCAAGLASVTVLVLFVLFTGVGRATMLRTLGLESLLYGKRSILNCSRPENATDPFCRPRSVTRGEHEWRDLRNSGGKVLPFNLH